MGDSQLNNNRYLRSLIWNGENPVDSAPQDLSLLLYYGYLLPAVRTGMKLRDVWSDLVARGVPETPSSDAYIRFVETELDGRQREYDADDVSRLFRSQVLSAFGPDSPVNVSADVKRLAHSYVSAEDPLHFIKFRRWLQDEVNRGDVTQWQQNQLDKAARAAYRLGLPKSLRVSADIPVSPSRFWTPVDIRMGDRRTRHHTPTEQPHIWRLPPFVLSRKIFADMPADLLPCIRSESSRGKVVKRLAEFEKTGTVNEDELVGELERYFIDIDRILLTEAPGSVRDEYLALKRRQKVHASLVIAHNEAVSIVGIIPDHPALALVAAFYGLIITAFGSIATIRQTWGEQGPIKDGIAVGLLAAERAAARGDLVLSSPNK
ncbi:hypothetical protein ACFWBF_07405 [Streptomyces sp. NPDC060028]|uniref:hypothetical protein n=1 Tax=Streptomyces sp. NPDC060028 TaxID=3347041 RepID=UPI0036B35DF2